MRLSMRILATKRAFKALNIFWPSAHGIASYFEPKAIDARFKWGCRDSTRIFVIAVAGMTGFEPATIDGRTDKVRRVSFLAIATPIKHICLQMKPNYS